MTTPPVEPNEATKLLVANLQRLSPSALLAMIRLITHILEDKLNERQDPSDS